jgi:hypothetical protein
MRLWCHLPIVATIVLIIVGCICVPNIKELNDKILWEAHESAYSIHPGGNKMYHDLKITYWWYRIKRDVVKKVALFATPVRESKSSIKYPLGCCDPCKYLSRIGEEIAMDFIVGLPRTQSGYDSLWVIIDRLTKVAHFISIQMTYTGPQLAEMYMSRIACLHGVLKRIVFARGTQFISKS